MLENANIPQEQIERLQSAKSAEEMSAMLLEMTDQPQAVAMGHLLASPLTAGLTEAKKQSRDAGVEVPDFVHAFVGWTISELVASLNPTANPIVKANQLVMLRGIITGVFDAAATRCIEHLTAEALRSMAAQHEKDITGATEQ